jgi:hypothetical protein
LHERRRAGKAVIPVIDDDGTERPEAIMSEVRKLDPWARVLWSEVTMRFYVASRAIEDGSTPGVLAGICEHRRTPEEAVAAFWQRITDGRRLVINAYRAERTEIRRNFLTGEWQDAGSPIEAYA